MIDYKKIRSVAELIQHLNKEGISPDNYHLYIDRFMSLKAREKGIPYTGTFELTPLCNLDCKMCYVHLDKEQMRGRPLLTVEQWKSLMTQAAAAGMVKAKLTGGECLTYPGFDELYLHLQSLGVNIIVFTNGILLDDTQIRFFEEHPVYGIQVTLYGSSEEAYEKVTGRRQFETVCRNIRATRDADLPITLAITPNRFMEEDAMQIIDVAQSLGVPYAINSELFEPRPETGRVGQNINISLDTYIRMLKKQREFFGEGDAPAAERAERTERAERAERAVNVVVLKEEEIPTPGGNGVEQRGIRCAAGRSMFEIDWRGRMYGCSSLRSLYADPFDELAGGFAGAWRSINKRAINILTPAECVGCAYSEVCITCPAAHEQNGSSAHCNREYCERVKRMVEERVIEVGGG